ncbi:unnamed protein product [Anisakis simplex]|uniref:DnaJ homologue subfamily C GRV2/DNAJC13 N-terminal domain-containing protein n=1 Tax=Anisakis simplex TaxID=6269 RepID=A0A3P6Q7X0_ANISI|nr:unnamed protein product [Anisakis simplex]
MLCLSESCLVERDPASYAVVCARQLKSIVCLHRDEKDPQKFVVEYDTGASRCYAAPERSGRKF